MILKYDTISALNPLVHVQQTLQVVYAIQDLY